MINQPMAPDYFFYVYVQTLFEVLHWIIFIFLLNLVLECD